MGLEKLTHAEPVVTETAESKRSDPKGPTLAFSTCDPCFARSNLIAPFCFLKPTAYNQMQLCKTLTCDEELSIDIESNFMICNHNSSLHTC